MEKSERRKCINHPNKFCYVCGKYIIKSQGRVPTDKVKQAYLRYFGHSVVQDKEWTPKLFCISCYVVLNDWFNGKPVSMSFAVPMIWREQANHHDDCYFCLTSTRGISKKIKSKIEYPNVASVSKPIPHSEKYPVPLATDTAHEESDILSNDEEDVELNRQISEYIPTNSSLQRPHLIEQHELNDLIRVLDLPVRKAEILGSRLKEWHLLAPNTKVCVPRKRNRHLSNFFTNTESLCFCNNISELMEELGIPYDKDQWRLFIDGSKTSLKAVLLHNGSLYPSIPIAYSVILKESYENMQLILDLIKYKEYNWKVCADLKVVAILLGLQEGFTKYCFLCLWNSRHTKNHYKVKDWPKRTDFVCGKSNVKYEPLIPQENVILPPLHIKLGLMKNFVKAMDKNGKGFLYLKSVFSN